MAVTLEEFYQREKKQMVRLAAGRTGLRKAIRWVHMVENTEIAGFLTGNELAFVTGVGLKNEDGLWELIQSIAENGGCGVVVNLGRFIQNISEKILKYCDQLGLPVFTVPWEIRMEEIMRRCCLMIMDEEKAALEISRAFYNAIFIPEKGETYLPALKEHGLEEDWDYTVAVGKRDGAAKEGTLRKGAREFENCVEFMEYPANILELEKYLVLIFHGCAEEKICGMLKKIQETWKINGAGWGIGETVPLEKLGISYRQACYAAEIWEKGKKEQNAAAFRDLGVYKLLFPLMENKESMQAYMEEEIGAVLHYDSLNGSGLLEVLRRYLAHNGSVKETAQDIFVHRNTVNYKIHKIEELLGKNLSEMSVRVELDMALKIYTLLLAEG